MEILLQQLITLTTFPPEIKQGEIFAKNLRLKKYSPNKFPMSNIFYKIAFESGITSNVYIFQSILLPGSVHTPVLP